MAPAPRVMCFCQWFMEVLAEAERTKRNLTEAGSLASLAMGPTVSQISWRLAGTRGTCSAAKPVISQPNPTKIAVARCDDARITNVLPKDLGSWTMLDYWNLDSVAYVMLRMLPMLHCVHCVRCVRCVRCVCCVYCMI